jgi:hypothetical protein
MEPLSIILTALVAGATVVGKGVAGEAVKDAYTQLKGMLLHKFGSKGDIGSAIAQVEDKPESDGRKVVLEEELETAKATQDDEIVQSAEAMLDLLKEHGLLGPSYQAMLEGNGTIAQGGSVAAGKGGVAIGGNVEGGVRVTNQKDKEP